MMRLSPDMRLDFATAGHILFGAGVAGKAMEEAAQFGLRPLLVCGSSAGRARAAGLHGTEFPVGREPTIDDIRRGVRVARASNCDSLIAFGGGSVLDAAKAIAALLTNPGDPLDYLEVIGQGQPLALAAAPVVAIPTSAGTGSEVTRNAVLTSPEHGLKASLRHPSMVPRVALIDPVITLSLPPALTASTGVDALTQLIEPFVSVRANGITDTICREAIPRAARALPLAVENGGDLAARTEMAFASMCGGIALANAGLGAVHGFAAPIGGMFPAPHGAVCAALLPHAMRVNLRALRSRDPESDALRRYEDLARMLTGDPMATPEDGMRFLELLVARLEIPRLAAYGVTFGHVKELCEKAARSSSMKGNPIVLKSQELAELLESAI